LSSSVVESRLVPGSSSLYALLTQSEPGATLSLTLVLGRDNHYLGDLTAPIEEMPILIALLQTGATWMRVDFRLRFGDEAEEGAHRA